MKNGKYNITKDFITFEKEYRRFVDFAQNVIDNIYYGRETEFDGDGPSGINGRQGEWNSTHQRNSGRERDGGTNKERTEVVNREGEGSITDREVVMDSDPYSKALGRPRYTGRKMGEYVARQRMEMAKRVKALAQKLNLNIDVLESTEGLSGKRAKAKGWYEPKGKRIVVVIPNHTSVNDAVATVLHEVVGHKGLQVVMGDKLGEFLDFVYKNLPKNNKSRINNYVLSQNMKCNPITQRKAVADLGITQELLDDYYALVDEKQREAFGKQIAEEFYENNEYAEEYLARFVEELYNGKRLSSDNYNVLSRLKNAPENVRKQIEFIQQILNHIVNGRQGRNELRSGMVEGGFTGETLEGGKREGADVYDNATKKSEEGTATADDTRFRIEENSIDNVPTQPLTFTEKITNSVLEASARNKENLALRTEALRAYGSNLGKVLKKLMQEQRRYDKSTVDDLMKMAKMYFKNAQLLGHVTPYEVGRIMSVLHNAVGKRDITKDANKLVGILVDAHSKELENLLGKAAKTKAKKVNASGVEVIGSLDKMGQITLEAYNQGVELDEEAIEEKIVDAQNDTAHPEEAGARINGLMMALEYVTDIKQKQQEVKDLQKLLKEKARDAREGNMSRRAWKVMLYNEVENSKDILNDIEKELSLEQTNIQKDEKSILPERIVDRILRGYSRRGRGEQPTGEITDIIRRYNDGRTIIAAPLFCGIS